MATQNSSPTSVAHEVRRVLDAVPEGAQAIGGSEKINQILGSIHELDSQFEQRGGTFFHVGENAFETAQRFNDVHIEQYRDIGRPSLPSLAIHHAEALGLDRNSPEYKSMILVAVRAEVQAAAEPDYHSKHHYADVAAMTANLVHQNNELASSGVSGCATMNAKEQSLTFIAAIGHDLDHDGKGNPPDDHYLNERKSFQAMEPILQSAGLPPQDISQVATILQTTSPNGPHSVLKEIAKAQRSGQEVDFDSIKDSHKFPELKVLAQNPSLTQMAAIVSDSDLYASSGAGLEANKKMSALLTSEVQKSGATMDLTTDGSRKFFLDHIVGQDGYASSAGRHVAGESLEALRHHTNLALEGGLKNTSASTGLAISSDSASPTSVFTKIAEKKDVALDHASHGVGVVSAVVNAGNGDYVAATQDLVGSVAENEKVQEATVKGIAKLGLTEAFTVAAKHTPLVGGLVTAGYVAVEVGGHLMDGHAKIAMASLVAGSAEALGNASGVFGVGDAMREATRSGIIAAGGDEFASVGKSQLRELAEGASDVIHNFSDKPEASPVVSLPQKQRPSSPSL